ncbi:hypothetical protein [Intestinibacter sp.]
MLKKVVISSILIAGLTLSNLSSITYSYANDNISNYEFSSEQIERIVGREITYYEENKIENDFIFLKEHGIDVDLIYDIEFNDNYVYKLKYSNGIKESITLEYKNEKIILDIKQGEKHDLIEVNKKSNEICENGQIVKIVEDIELAEGVDETELIMPLDRVEYNVIKPPYGTASDYNSMQYMKKCASVPLAKQMKDYTVSALSIILNDINPVIGLSFDIANTIIGYFPESTSHGLSYKNYVYYHKDGHFISKVGGTVDKNNVRWYEKENYSGKTFVKATYTIKKLM